MTLSPADLVGRTLSGGYRVIRPLGQGGMGVVYEAEQERPKRRVALKVLFDHDERALARFQQEARAMAAVNHPNVATVFELRHEKGEPPFFVLELVSGTTLGTLLRREQRLAPERAVRIATQMLDALDAAHRAGVIHRDVKPGNVMLGPHDDVKLLDFGIAKLAEGGSVKTTTGAIIGTPAYLSPEQILAQPVDARTDVFAVGMVLYEMLTGKRARHDQTPVLEGIAPPIAAAVVRALEPRKEDRFESARAMHDALLGKSAPRALVPAEPVKTRSPVVRVVVIALLVAVPSTVALAFLLPRSPVTRPSVVDAAPTSAPESDAAPIAEADADITPVVDTPVVSTPSASADAPASARKPLANCWCRDLRSDGYHNAFCPTPMRPVCRCIEDKSGPTICPTKFEHGAKCPSTKWPVPGDEGDPCEGWYDPETGIEHAKGQLSCEYCYGNVPGVAAKHGTLCKGFDSGRHERTGVWLCEGLIPPGAPGGMPRPVIP